MITGMRVVRKVAGQQALKNYINEEMSPGVDVTDNAALLDFVRQKGSTIFDPGSTSRMGTDPQAVVSPTLKVNGLDGVDC